MDPKQEAIFFFRKLVYVVYLEIGALTPAIHPELAQKARLKSAYFQREKERQASNLYHQVEQEEDPMKIVAPFEERTGLSLEDVHRAFAEGDWRNKFGAWTFGGPRWERIAASTLALRDAILREDWDATGDLLFEIKGLKNNQGYLIKQFERTERRR